MTTSALLPALISAEAKILSRSKPANSVKICHLGKRRGKQGNPRADVRRLAVFRYTPWQGLKLTISVTYVRLEENALGEPARRRPRRGGAP